LNLTTNKKKNLYILLTLLSIFMVNAAIINVNYTPNDLNRNVIDEVSKEPKNNDLTSNNIYNGIGEAWNVTHWANRTDYNIPANFGNNSYDILEMPLGIDWIGYDLKADINDLYDSRNWNNGTFNFGNDDGSYLAGEDDTPEISNIYQNWTFTDSGTNIMSGNYMDSSSVAGRESLELRMDGQGSPNSYTYHQGDICSWQSTINIPRGKVLDSELSFEVNPYHLMQFNSHVLSFSINGKIIYSIGSLPLYQFGSGWHSLSIPQGVWTNSSTIYSDPLNSSSVQIGFSWEYVPITATYNGFTNGNYQQIFLDNVKLIVKAEAQPSQLQLKANNTSVSDVDWGKGTIELTGDWESTTVSTSFSSDSTWDLSSYDIELEANLNLFAYKNIPETSYDTNFASEGTNFYTENNSAVNWDCYAYFAVPTGYEETTMKLEFPSDVTLTWVSEPQQPTTNRLAQCDITTPGILFIPVNTISETPDGFWRFEGSSSNYLEQLTLYKNSTSSPTGTDWVQEQEFLSGDYINITAKVNPGPLISSYISQTKAILNIRFPNGTIWTAQNQIKSCDSNGMIFFDYIQLPLNPPNYEVGEYEVIISWNNSYSNFGLNESGIIYKSFTVKHFSNLVPDQLYYANIFEGSSINLIVSFTDRQNGDSIENAIVYLYNFTGGIEYFNEINPGYYALLDFNTTGGLAGDNILMIYANSTLYTNNQASTTINLILKTSLSAEEFPYLQVAWNQNFTIHLNYTELISGNGIVTAPTSNWLGEYSTTMISPGFYNMLFNSSAYEVNKIHSLIIYVNEPSYEPQSLLIKVEIIDRETYIDNVMLNGNLKTTDKSITLTSGELLNISFSYKDQISANYLSGALARVVGGGLSENLTENLIYHHYEIILNTSALQIGATFLTISAQLQNYSSSATVLTIYIGERGSTLEVLLNGASYPNNYITVEVWETINITVKFRDLITSAHLTNASIQLIGHGNFTENPFLQQYNFTIDASLLGQGIDILNIIATKNNYQSQPAQVTIEITERKTNLQLFLNGNNQTVDPFLDIPIGSLINITIKYSDLLGNFIDTADVKLLGEGLSLSFTEDFSLEQYSLSLNTRQLDIGVRLLTVVAQRNNYQLKAINLRLDIRRISTNITTLSGATTINISPGQSADLKIVLIDLDFGGYILNASVSYRWQYDEGVFTDTNNDGIYEALISNIPDGSYTITITAFAGDDYSFDRYEVVVTVIRPSGEVFFWLMLLVISSIVTVSALTYLYAYQKVLKYPKQVRKVRKYSKTLGKTKNPRIDIAERKTAFNNEYQNELKKSSKLLKGRTVVQTPKPEQITKKPIEGLKG